MENYFNGYYRFPTICQDRIIFVAEDDLWTVPTIGGIAQRLTANLGETSQPVFSPCGKWIAFTGREEGMSEIYLMPSTGGPAKRLTWQGSPCAAVTWKDNKIIYASLYASANSNWELFSIDLEGNQPERLPYGLARYISYGEKGNVLGRNTGDLARWKRYRGGTAGVLWIDKTGEGYYEKLEPVKSNLSYPLWIKDRIYFVADEDGIGNIYSCTPDGGDVKQHTFHQEFYARNLQSDGINIVYHAGADLFVYNVEKNTNTKLDIHYASPLIQKNRKFVNPVDYVDECELSPDGGKIMLNSRGKLFTMGCWEGSVMQAGKLQGVRYRCNTWFNDKKRMLTVSDEGGIEHLEIHNIEDKNDVKVVEHEDMGRILRIYASPAKDDFAIINNRLEIKIYRAETGEITLIDKGLHANIGGCDWSLDGSWFAYAIALTNRTQSIKIYSLEENLSRVVTNPILADDEPVFDPEGNFLYLVSARTFNPVYDHIHFDLSFTKPYKPYLITLRKDVLNPFIKQVKPYEDEEDEDKDDKDKKEGHTEEKTEDKKDEKVKEEVKKVVIDFDSILDRIIAFPVDEGNYGNLAAVEDRVFYMSYPVEGALTHDDADEPHSNYTLKVYDFETLEDHTFLHDINGYSLSRDKKALLVGFEHKLRVVSPHKGAEEELPKEEKPSRKSGWINLNRIKVSIDPTSEWKQMFSEAWRLQKEYFWNEDMSGIDWQKIHDRYFPLVERVASRLEFSDLAWEMQGELGTSHCYEFGGNYKSRPVYRIGQLCADFVYDSEKNAYRIKDIAKGDVWNYQSPLRMPGCNIVQDSLLYAINGEYLSKEISPEKLLVNQANMEIELTVSDPDGENRRKINLKTIKSDSDVRYRDWVEKNREYVHQKTDGKVGYVHIPDMGAYGYAEFHRYFLTELEHDGLIVDVRFNGGGHVSALILEKLARKRIGYDLTRWFGSEPYPGDSVAGPIIALTNELAGSDGDIFSHSFKLMKLGKLVGKRTWGGVIGIWPRNWLVDGTVTTQPEFSFWFKDVGWGVENYGTDPDIEVDIAPHDYAAGKDPQLDRTIEEILKDIIENPPLKPDFSQKPNLKLPYKRKVSGARCWVSVACRG